MRKVVILLFLSVLFIFSFSIESHADANGSTTEASTDDSYEIDIPVSDVNVISPAQAPSMAHSGYDDNPAQAVYRPMMHILTKYKFIVIGVAGLIDLFLIGVVIFRFVKLGNCPNDNANERRSAISALAISLFAVAVMGSLTLWYGLFFNALH